MEMKSMKLSKKEATEAMPKSISEEKPQYPYGLRISLDNDALEKLGIKTLPASGKVIMVIAKCEVKSVNESDYEGEKRKSMELQITDLCLETEKKDFSKSLYGDKEK